MFSGERGYTRISQPVCLCVSPVHVSFCVQNTSFCQSCGVGIKSHLVTAVVFTPFTCDD